MALLSSADKAPPGRRKPRRAPTWPIVVASLTAAAAVTLIGYLLWPTFRAEQAGDPGRIPIEVGATLFNVPTDAFRIKVQKHSGPQERVDLNFSYPSLDPPAKPKHVSVDGAGEIAQPIDRIFLSIAAHHDAMSPETRLRSIFPRYLEPAAQSAPDGLTKRTFREGTPYAAEDLFTATTPALAARCTRDGVTPGMCLSERRIDGTDLTFRFPRQWLSQWQDLAAALDRLTAQLHGSRG
ncbi:hypothetical protein HNR60_004658 [Rhodopseudomonas rhenobacensis]|uniref:Uncharacterized protein n=1 Tax=Rhodopseudomonas rhenobacensis TaxID=87461 RepID=A0A7W7Z8J8_9BRAD|nr:hypothetical protein [Rhodopseudomonas rhenobacensis]MBB5049874.1 hypothetical protein [Rhodopseudomonas rhenobacensis]